MPGLRSLPGVVERDPFWEIILSKKALLRFAQLGAFSFSSLMPASCHSPETEKAPVRLRRTRAFLLSRDAGI